MKFFIPHVDTPEEAEKEYQAIKAIAQKAFLGPYTKRRIFKIEFMHSGCHIWHEIEVGRKANFHGVEDEVKAIFESKQRSCYLICTFSKSAASQTPMPIIVSSHEVRWIEDFEY